MTLPTEPLEEAVYGSYDPTQLPTPGRPAEAVSVDPGAVAAEPEAAPDEPPLPEFDARLREEFSGLLYLGALTRSFTWLGHRFQIRTLRTGELTEAALIIKEHAGSDGWLKAWQGAIVAAATVSVDGRPLPVVPLTDRPGDTSLRGNYEYVMAHWFPPVLDKIYQEYVELELVVRQVIEAMGKASG